MTRNEKYWLNHKIINEVLHRKCSVCKEWKPETIEYYYLHNKNKPEKGFCSECKICGCNRSKKYGNEHREQQSASFKKWYEEHKEYMYEINTRWFNEHPEFKSPYMQEWRKNNPDKVKIGCDKHRDHDVSSKEEKAMLQVFNYECCYCGMTLEDHKNKYHEKLHNDHVDDDGYNDLRNDAPACKPCNTSKHTEDMETWFRRQSFFSEDKFNKIIWWTTEGYKNHIENKPPYKICRVRVYREDGTWYMQHELWSVDEKRNMIECIAVRPKKKDLNDIIKAYINELKQSA